MNHTDKSENLDLFIDLIRRSPLLTELQQGALDRGELEERLSISRATSHRYTRLLGEWGVIEKANGKLTLTESGKLLTDALVRFKQEANSALQLAPVLDVIQNTPVAIDIKAFAGATVTSAEHGDPYSPVARFVSLVQETDTLRGFDMGIIAPFYMVEIQQRIIDGMETKAIALPAVVGDTLTEYPDKCTEACASGYLTVWLHNDLPFGLVIFDDRVGIGVPERDTRNLRLFVDTDSPAVRTWAEAIYELYSSEAVRMEEYTQRGYQQAKERWART